MNAPEEHICQEIQATQFPGCARRLSDNIHNGEVDEHQVTRNVSPMQEQDGEYRVATGRNKESDGHQVTRNTSPIQVKDKESRMSRRRSKEVQGCQVTRNISPNEDGESRMSRGRNRDANGHQVTRNISPIQNEEGESRKRFSTASGSYIFQNRYSPGTSACDQCIVPKVSTQVFNKDILYVPHVGCEDKWGAEVTADQCYFLDKRQFQFKSLTERNARKHLTERDSAKGLHHLETEQYRITPQEYTDEDDEYWRRDSKLREDVIIEESFLDQPISDVHQQWYRARELRSEYLRSQAAKNTHFWLIIFALFMTFITGVLVVIVWEYLSIISFERMYSSNSSLPYKSGTESTPGHGDFLYK